MVAPAAPPPGMGFDATAPLDYLAALVAGLPGVQGVVTGVPESITPRVSAYVTLGGATVLVKNTGAVSLRTQRYVVTLCYRVAGAEDTAERTLAGVFDALLGALDDDKTLGGAVHSSQADASLADAPAYAVVAGQEYRLLPIVVSTTQTRGFSPNQPP